MADVLFPQAAGWQAVSQLEPLQRDELGDVTAYVADAMERAKISFDGVACDFAKDSLSETADLGAWRWADFDGDGSGEDDLLYAGPIPCMEGSMTLGFAWDGTTYAAVPAELAHTQALRIRPAKDPQLVSLSAGCCADPVDVYRLGSLSVPMATGPEFMKRNVTVIEGTVTPGQALAAPESFTSGNVLFLRASPEIKDEYDAGLSDMMSHAMFGNQLRVYMSGTQGRIHARQKDAAGQDWVFVTVDGDCERLLLADPYSNAEGAFAGWALAEQVK